jgi:hypothetical protein
MVSGIIFVAVVGYSASFISFLGVLKWIGFIEQREKTNKKNWNTLSPKSRIDCKKT